MNTHHPPLHPPMEQVVQHTYNVSMHNEFFSDKLKMPRNENFGYANADEDSKNLIKKSFQLSAKGDTLDVFSYHYLFDEKGRVISVVQLTRSGEEYDSTAYTYY